MIPGNGRDVSTPGVLFAHKAGQQAKADALAAPAAPPMPTTWAELTGDLPDHTSEVLAAHQGSPSIAVQSATHGAPLPAVDAGKSDQAKYA